MIRVLLPGPHEAECEIELRPSSLVGTGVIYLTVRQLPNEQRGNTYARATTMVLGRGTALALTAVLGAWAQELPG